MGVFIKNGCLLSVLLVFIALLVSILLCGFLETRLDT